MYTTQQYKDLDTGITWEGTGEILDVIDMHDYEEVVTGEDEEGNTWQASATVSCGIIQEIIEPELISS